ncbi:MAG: beta-ketoacyl-ACP synthase I [Alphaproteobacteria bacterium]|nr:beta-ketoacyl-ACP synthase I [Alphaproteobacteria bacterium]
MMKPITPRRVVVTGLGIVSCIGNSQDEVIASLKSGKSGISFSQEYADLGFRSQVYGKPNIDLEELVDRRMRRFMGEGAQYCYVAMSDAIKDSGLDEDQVSNPRTGLIIGTGGPSAANQVLAANTAKEKTPKRVGPYQVPRCMSSTASATLSTYMKIKGVNYSISSACSTSGHCIGNAAEQIMYGKQDIVFAGGGEELSWELSCLFDGMGAMSSKYNDTPERASRAYDSGRDGFVIAGGAGILVLEEYEHAKARGAKIYAELTGYGATSDGHDMVAPSGEGAVRCMQQALETVEGNVDYINTHGTSTPVGDITELEGIRKVFEGRGEAVPAFSSTKSMTGHSLGGTSAQEAIYSLLMMKHGFICPSINVENKDDGAEGLDLVTECREGVELNTVLSNSFGFGGTNCCLAFSKVE